MSVVIKCNSRDKVYCAWCGSKVIVAQGSELSHCGKCGKNVTVEYTEGDYVETPEEDFVQMSLFG